MYDEYTDNAEEQPRNDLYFTDLNGIVNKINCDKVFGTRKKMSMRKREKVHAMCVLDQDKKSIYVTEMGRPTMRVYEKISYDRMYKDIKVLPLLVRVFNEFLIIIDII